MSDIQTNEVPTPAVAVANPVTPAVPVSEVPNVPVPAAVVSEPPVGAAPAVGAEPVAPTATLPVSELAHVFEAFEHFSLMEGISRLYALAKKYF